MKGRAGSLVTLKKYLAAHDAHAALGGGEGGVEGGVGIELGDRAVGEIEFLKGADGGLGGVARGAEVSEREKQQCDSGRGAESGGRPRECAVVARAGAGSEEVGVGRGADGEGGRGCGNGAEAVEVFPHGVELGEDGGVLGVLLQPTHELGGLSRAHPAVAQAEPRGGGGFDHLGRRGPAGGTRR
jgi:hypothetical protein